jgi:hypothetical protein
VLFEVEGFHTGLRCADIVTVSVPHWHVRYGSMMSWGLGLPKIEPLSCNVKPQASSLKPWVSERSQASGLKPEVGGGNTQNPAEAGSCGSTGGQRIRDFDCRERSGAHR